MPRWTHQDGLLPGICFDTPYEHGGHFGPGSRKHKTRKKQDKKYKQANNLNGPNKGWGKSPKAKSDAYHKVNSYIRGDKTAYPSVHTIRTAWPELSTAEQKTVAKKYLRDRASSIHGEYDNPRKPPTFLRKYDSKKYDAILASTAQGAADRANQAATDEAFNNDLGRAVEFGALVAPVGPLAGALVKGARALKAAKGVEEAATVGRGAKVAEEAATTARATTSARRGARAVEALKSTRAARAARTAAKESSIGRGAAAVGRGASKAAATKGGRAALRTAAVGSKPITSPIKVGYPTYLGTSAAVAGVSGENIPDAVANAATLDPSGAFKDITSAAGNELDKFGIVGRAVKDTLELPAAVVPSTVMLGVAAVQSVKGETVTGPDGEQHDPLDLMVGEYVDKGALPGLLKGLTGGGFDQLGEALNEHPVMSGLEFYGAGAGLSRLGGAAARSAPKGSRLNQIGSIERKPLTLADGTKVPREYKKGLVGKAAGVLRDQRRAARNRAHGKPGQKAGPKESEQVLRGGFWKSGLADRAIGKGNLVTRYGRSEMQKIANDVLPEGRGATAKANRRGLVLAVTYGAPKTGATFRGQGFMDTLKTLRTKAAAEGERLRAIKGDKSIPKKDRDTAKLQLKENEKFVAEIEDVLKNGDSDAILAALDAAAPQLRKLQRQLVKANVGLEKGQAEKAALIPPARLHLDAGYGVPKGAAAARPRAEVRAAVEAEHPTLSKSEVDAVLESRMRGEGADSAPQVLDKNGNSYSLDQIKTDLRARGIDPENVGFLSQRPGAGGRGDFWQPWYPNGGFVASKARTGEASIRGWNTDVDTFVGQMVRSRGIVDNARTFRDAMRQFAWKGPRGRIQRYSSDQVAGAKTALQEKTGMEWESIKLRPEVKGRSADELMDIAADDLGSLQTQSELWQAAIQEGPGRYILIPKAVHSRFNEHFKPASVFEQTFQMVNQAFKGTVLPYSPKWLASNFADTQVRAMISGQPPVQRLLSTNYKFANDMLNEAERLDPVRGSDAKALFGGGSHMGSQTHNHYYGRAENLANMSRFGEAMLRFRKAPTVDGAVRLHESAKRTIFGFNQEMIENPGRLSILGKQLRQEAIQKGFIRRWESVWKLDEAARRGLAKGLLETDSQIRYAKGIERVFGQWDSNSPQMRRFLVSYAPFGMWTRAATKFVFQTMPADHPVLTGIIAATERMTEDERQKLGLSFFGDNKLPGNLRGGLPLGDGSIIGGVQGMTSFGFFADPANAMASTLYPQVDDIKQVLGAQRDWTGKKLEHADHTPLSDGELALVALLTGAEAFFPPAALYQRYQSISDADSIGGAVRNVTVGKPTSPDILDYLRAREENGVFEGVRGSSTSSSDGYSSPYSSSGSSIPSFLDSYNGGSSSSSSSSFLDSYGGG